MNFAEKLMEGAPEEIKTATLKANRAFLRVRKAMGQVELWKKEQGFADKDFQTAQAEQQDLLLRWDDSTNTLRPKLEEAPVVNAVP